VLADRAARDTPAVAAMDSLHHPPGSLRGLQRGIDVLLRMPPAHGYRARLWAQHDFCRQISVLMRAGTADAGQPPSQGGTHLAAARHWSNRAWARFSLACGQPLDGEPKTPPELRRSVSIIFADLVGSTVLGESLHAEALQQWTTRLKGAGPQHVALAIILFCALDSAVCGASTVLYVPLSVRLGPGANGYSYLLAGAALGACPARAWRTG
jgi:hypothetical protein